MNITDERVRIILTGIVVCAVIFGYGKYRCDNPEYKDPLEVQKRFVLDGWSATHFAFFLYLGYTFPDHTMFSFALGALWELFEHYYDRVRPPFLKNFGGGECDMRTDRKDGNWWYGKYSDLLMNGLGLFFGYYFKMHM